MSGFEFRETMAGSFHFVSEPHNERPMSFTVRARSRSMLQFLRRPVVDLEGEVDAPPLASHRMLRGTLDMNVLRTGTLPYLFHFQGDDGRSYVFEGKKTYSLSEALESMTVLPGVIKDESDKEIAQALLRFDVRSDLFRFLKSFRRSA